MTLSKDIRTSLILLLIIHWLLGCGRAPIDTSAAEGNLERLLADAIQARGGLSKLKTLKDDFSELNLVYGAVYKARVRLKTWTLPPHYFRQDMVKDGVILKTEQYNGEQYLLGSGNRVYYGLGKDLRIIRENMELNKIISVLPIGNKDFPARLGRQEQSDGNRLQEVQVTAPSGLIYHLFFELKSHLITRIEYNEQRDYAGDVEAYPTIVFIDAYHYVEGIAVPKEIRIFSEGSLVLQATLIKHKFNTGLMPEFFSMEKLKKDLAVNSTTGKPGPVYSEPHREWKQKAADLLTVLLAKEKDCRFREVTAYGDADIYRQRLLDSPLTVVVDGEYLLKESATALYAAILPAPEGFYIDCIILREPPGSKAVKAETLLHEMTHAVLRQHREKAPLLTADDEYLAYYQSRLFYLGKQLSLFERLVFDPKRMTEPKWIGRAAKVWNQIRQAYQKNYEDSRLSAEALNQFREWCGVDFDLIKVRQNYLKSGVPSEVMPLY